MHTYASPVNSTSLPGDLHAHVSCVVSRSGGAGALRELTGAVDTAARPGQLDILATRLRLIVEFCATP